MAGPGASGACADGENQPEYHSRANSPTVIPTLPRLSAGHHNDSNEATHPRPYLAVGWDLVEDVVWSVLRSRVPSYYLAGVRIFPSEHAADSSFLGAVALVLSQFFTSFVSP